MTPPRVLGQYLDFIEQHLSLQGRMVVDFGCGTSSLWQLINSRGAHYVGVEHVPEARQELARAGAVAVARLEDAPRADLVTMIEAIEHLEVPATVLSDIRSKLDPRGYLFISTPNAGGLRARLLRSRWEQAENPTHTTLFTRHGLRAALEQTGFRIVAYQRRVDFGKNVLHPILQTVRLDGAIRVIARLDR